MALNYVRVPEHSYLQPVYVPFQCESMQPMLERLTGQRGALRPQLEGFEQDTIRLKEWASGLTVKREQLESSLTTLRDAVEQIEERTSTITKDLSYKVELLILFRCNLCRSVLMRLT